MAQAIPLAARDDREASDAVLSICVPSGAFEVAREVATRNFSGIYVDAKPGVAARVVRLITQTPGWSVELFGRNTLPNPDAYFTPPSESLSWRELGQAPFVHHNQNITLSSPVASYRYYLVWITKLPAVQESVSVNEIALYK